jgi:ArsR family transcriptional regulator
MQHSTSWLIHRPMAVLPRQQRASDLLKESSSVKLFREALMKRPLYEVKAEFFRNLGHPARIRVLELLTVQDYAVHELLAEIPIEPSNLSHQLGVLRRAGLIRQDRRDGQVYYSVAVAEIRDLLLAARAILSDVVSDQIDLRAELRGDWLTSS